MGLERDVVNPVESRKRILVTGAPRGGTTWAGQMIARAPGMGYIHEPFTPENGDLCGFANPFTVRFQYITDENSYKFEKYLENLVDFKYPVQDKSCSVQEREGSSAKNYWLLQIFPYTG